MANPNPRTDQLAPFRWQPGQSGNPSGRPRSRSLTVLLREVLEATEINGVLLKPEGMTVGRALVESIVGHAINGDATLAKEILTRIEGKAQRR